MSATNAAARILRMQREVIPAAARFAPSQPFARCPYGRYASYTWTRSDLPVDGHALAAQSLSIAATISM
jgi:hypothetical protein